MKQTLAWIIVTIFVVGATARAVFPLPLTHASPDHLSPGVLPRTASGPRFLHLTLTALGITSTDRPDSSGPPARSGWGDKVSIEVSSEPTTLNIPFARLAPSRADGPLGRQYGLRTFQMVRRQHGVFSDLVGTVLYDRNAKEVTTLILCDPNWPSPPCRHRFQVAGLNVTATYSMTYLSQWRDIEQAIGRLRLGGIPNGLPK